MRFELQLCVELFRRARFFGVDLLFPGFVPAEADFLAAQIAAVEPDGRAGEAFQEGAVVADDQECAAIAIEPTFEEFDGRQIEMVRRLVHQQQVGILRQRAGNGGAALLAAAGALGRTAHIDAELAGDRLDLVFLRRVHAVERPIHQRGVARKIGILFEQDDARAGLDLARPCIGFQLAVDHAEQRGLPDPVAADQGQPVAGPDMQVERVVIRPAEQPLAALLQGHAFEAEDGGLCHNAARGSRAAPKLQAPTGRLRANLSAFPPSQRRFRAVSARRRSRRP